MNRVLWSCLRGTWLALLLCSLCLASARADDPWPVELDASACTRVPYSELAAALRVELGARFVDEPSSTPVSRVTLSCAADGADIMLRDPDGAPVATHVRLSAAPDNVRARIVALAIVELVRDHARPPPPPEPPAPPPLAEPAAPPRALGTMSRITLLGQGARFAGGDLWLGGGGLGVSHFRGRFGLGLDALLLTSRPHHRSGNVRVWLGHANPHVAVRERLGRVEGQLGLGCAVGLASISAHPLMGDVRTHKVQGAWAAPNLLFLLDVALISSLRAGASFQLGYVALPVRADVARARPVELDRLFLSLSFALSWVWERV